MPLYFDPQSMVEGNIFKYEERLKSVVAKFIEGGPTYTVYYSLNENSSTTDRWTGDVDKLFGRHAPLKYNQISNFPVYAFGHAKPENTDEQQIEDINIDGECIVLPSTIVPHPNDFFSVTYIKQPHLFQVTDVERDSAMVQGFYKIKYHLITTSYETIQAFLTYQVLGKYVFDENALSTDANSVITEETATTKEQAEQMVNQMIDAYRSLFYNERHNCFLYHDEATGWDWFDMCGNEFIAKYALMNYTNAGHVIVLHHKLIDKQFPIKYNNSIFQWIELGAPIRFLRHFYFLLGPAAAYPYSSFVLWGDDDIQIIHPLGSNEDKLNSRYLAYIDETQFNAFLNPDEEPLNDYEKLIHRYIHKEDLSLNDISPYTADALISSVRHRDIYLYTPIIIYIIRHILGIV